MYEKLCYKSIKNLFISNFNVNHLFLDFLAEVEEKDEDFCREYFIKNLKKYVGE